MRVVGVVVLLILNSGFAAAAVFKCIDEHGTIHYQGHACDDNENESVLKVKTESAQAQQTTEPSKYQYVNGQSRFVESAPGANPSPMEHCQPLLTNYSKLKNSIKEQCVKERKSYCDLTAAEIEAKNYAGNRNVINSQTFKPPLVKLKEQLQSLYCL